MRPTPADPEAWNAYLAEGNATQARKRVAADVLLRDAAGRVLLVNPTYKPGWDLLWSLGAFRYFTLDVDAWHHGRLDGRPQERYLYDRSVNFCSGWRVRYRGDSTIRKLEWSRHA